VRKLNYDAINDFTPIAMVGGTPNILTVTPNVPVKDLAGFVDYAKKNPTKLNYGTGGIGLLNHLALEQFRAAAGIEEVTYGHYRGIGPALTDMLGGQIQVLMPGLAAALPHIRSGKIKPLAITGLTRHPLVPDVPTFEESGYKGFDGVQWYGIVGPAKMPADVTKRLNAEINKAITSPALQQRLASEALQAMPMTPEQFGKFIQDDIAKWSALAKARNIHLDD
jgi:tripartite-type tricarboxylate transporter receptor subunit TctC